MSDILTELRARREEISTALEGLLAAEDFDPADETFVRAKADAEKLDARIASVVEFQQRRASQNEIDALSIKGAKEAQKRQATTAEPRSLGEAFVRSKAYEDFKSAPRGTSGHVQFPMDKLFRAPIETGDFADPIIPDGRLASVSEPPARTPLLDLIPRINVNTNSVDWVVYPLGGDAGVVAEGTAKPEATFAPTISTVSLDILAHWVQVTRSVMEDAPALMGYINSELRAGVLRKVESQAVAVLTGATLPETSYDNTPGTGDKTLLHGIRQGIATVQEAGYQPNAVMLNPADYADLDLNLLGQTVVNTGTGPQIGQTYWGIRPVPVSGVAVGTAYLGDFGVAMANLMRSDVAVYTTDSHASTFTSNVLTTLAEVRAKAVVQRADALTKIIPVV